MRVGCASDPKDAGRSVQGNATGGLVVIGFGSGYVGLQLYSTGGESDLELKLHLKHEKYR